MNKILNEITLLDMFLAFFIVFAIMIIGFLNALAQPKNCDFHPSFNGNGYEVICYV